MWRRSAEREEVVEVLADVCVTVPLGTRFQFRSLGREPLAALGVTIPRWPGDGEATVVDGPWKPTVKRWIRSQEHEVTSRRSPSDVLS